MDSSPLIKVGNSLLFKLKCQIWSELIHLKHTEGHTLIVGTTGSGKTRMFDILISQAILRGEAVIIIDPKGDKEMRDNARRACEAMGQPERFVSFHPAFPEESVRIDPLRNFTRVTEIASRLAALIPSEEERQKSKGMQDMGKGWFAWVKGRMEAFVNVIYQFYTRLALLAAWAPYMLILFVPAVYDGMMTWRIKRTNFDYASPVLHRYSVRGTMYLMAGLFIAFFIPIALDPVVIPLTMMTCCVLVGLTFGNLQKRV